MRPIVFRGESFYGKKCACPGVHRVKSAEETWKQIASLAPQVGVTRLANITGLDRIGIPVTLAIRPGSMTLTTSSGKGLTLEAALVSWRP